MEMEQLLSMGFPDELAAEALGATGGKSILKATEWILSRRPSTPPPNNPPPSQPKLDRFFAKPTTSDPPPNNPSPSQPKLDRFFAKPTTTAATTTAATTDPPSNNPSPSQPKLDRSFAKPTTTTAISMAATSTGPAMKRAKTCEPHVPLSERMRPRTLHEVVGQDQLLSPTSLLGSAVDANRLPSIILWGPPGTGKTSIAKAIVGSVVSLYRLVCLSAITCGVKDVREAVEEARRVKMKNNGTKRTVLFVDEVHRFNKSQQDSFLPVIEDGSIVFIGATTENPSFHLITPLLSRCRVLTLNALKPPHVETLLRRALEDVDRGVGKSVGVRVEVKDGVIEFLSSNCDGDARVALNALEISATRAAARLSIKQFKSSEQEQEQEMNSVSSEENVVSSVVAIVTLEDAKEAFQCKHLAYDRAGDEHYNLISALHKSMRGNDANAAIYWLARMLEGGEQPLYIARRLIRFASEDVGLADPLALNQAVSCYQACHFLGMPECNVILAQCVAYLALAPKSISVYRAIEAAQKAVRESVGQNEGVPLHLRNAPTNLMKELGYGKGYIYTPDNPLAPQSYLPPSLQGYKFLDWPTSDTINI